MAFHFRLEMVLRVARVREECEWNRVQAIHAEVAALNSEMSRLQETELLTRRGQTNPGRPAAWLHIATDTIDELQRRERVVNSRLQETTARLDSQTRKYVAAHQSAETLRRLRETAFAEFRREAERRQQKTLDDVFLNRYR